MYVANFGSNNVSRINSYTNDVTETIDIGTRPVDLAYNPSNNNMYVANFVTGDFAIITQKPGQQ